MKKTYKLINFGLIFALAFNSFSAFAKPAKQKKNNKDKTPVVTEEEKPEVVNLKAILQNIDISLVSAADIPFAGKPFQKPYIVKVSDKEGNPYSNLEINVTYPAAKKDGKIEFGSTVILTDETGTVSFKPEMLEDSINSTVTFTPVAPANNSLVKLAKASALEVPCKVKLSLPKGRYFMVSLVDYNENDKMVLSSSLSTSSSLMGEIWKAGYPYQAQNADFHKAIDNGPEGVWKAARNLVGASTLVKAIISGKVKYAEPVKQVDEGYSLTLTANVDVIDFATGDNYYSTTVSTTVVDSNQWNVLRSCQMQLAKDLADILVYEM